MSDCGICITHDFEGPADVWESINRKARKQYRCCECGKTIEVGDTYELYSILYDGSWSKYKTCLVCAEIAAAFCCDGRIFGTLWSDFHDCDIWQEITTACFDKLDTPEAKAELRRRWMRWKGLVA